LRVSILKAISVSINFVYSAPSMIALGSKVSKFEVTSLDAPSGSNGASVSAVFGDATLFWFYRPGFRARTNMPLVLGELLKPVSPPEATSTKPVFFKYARKSISGIAPPSH
jgi:hypothetical protein